LSRVESTMLTNNLLNVTTPGPLVCAADRAMQSLSVDIIFFTTGRPAINNRIELLELRLNLKGH
jgi:hypothetical protein